MNMCNPHISKVHVALETRSDFSCTNFLLHIKPFFTERSKKHFMAKLECVPYEKQLTYLQMFEFAQKATRGSIALLVNSTVGKLR